MWKVRNFLCRRCWGCRHLFTTAAKAWAIFTGAIDRYYLVLWNITVSRIALKYNISKTLNKIFAGRRPHGDLTSHFLYGSLMKKDIFSGCENFVVYWMKNSFTSCQIGPIYMILPCSNKLRIPFKCHNILIESFRSGISNQNPSFHQHLPNNWKLGSRNSYNCLARNDNHFSRQQHYKGKP